MAKKKRNTPKRVVTIFPIHGLEMPTDCINELSIGNVTFIDSKKLPRIKKRLDIKTSYELHEEMYGERYGIKLPQSASAFAFIYSRQTDHTHDYQKELSEFRRAYYILASSFFFQRLKRKHASMSMTEDRDIAKFIVALQQGAGGWFRNHTRPLRKCATDNMWKNNTKKQYFDPIRKIAGGETEHLSRDWKEAICKAAVFSGQSFLSNNMTQAFLYNFIALESLVVGHNSKFDAVTTNRLISIFGWNDEIEKDDLNQKLKNLYDARNHYVHNGDSERITARMLHELDTILMNTLTNIINNISIFSSRDSFIEHSEKYLAREVLGLNQRYHRLKLSFTEWSFDEKDAKTWNWS